MFDIDAYLKRIAISSVGSADYGTLEKIQFAHRQAIPFENIDVMLDRDVCIDSASVLDKLVRKRRGGYCFEHNRLFLDALSVLGFTARPLLARVWLGATDTPPLTHTFSLVTIDGEDWIADAGFGGSYAPPMPLIDGARAKAPDGANFKLARSNRDEWVLGRMSADPEASGQEQLQYSFDLRQVHAADLEIGNHWTAKSPNSIFRSMLFVNIVHPDGFISLLDNKLKFILGDSRDEHDLRSSIGFRSHLENVFGLVLHEEEVKQLPFF